jgi:hypothetical protein
MANGFCLMPVILSYIGPLTDYHETEEEVAGIGLEIKAEGNS